MEAGSILVKRGLLSSQQLDQLRLDRPDTMRLDVAAVDLGLVSEEAALQALGDEVGIPFVDLEQQKIDLTLLRGFPLKLIHRHSVFPIERHERHAASRDQRSVRSLSARRAERHDRPDDRAGAGPARADRPADQSPSGRRQRDDRRPDGRSRTRKTSSFSTTSTSTAESFRRGPGSLGRSARERNPASKRSSRERATCTSNRKPPASRFATASTACLQPQPMPPEINRFQAAIISRLKIMARLNIAEKRLPQDGRIKLTVSGREIDVRVSVHPDAPRRRHRHAYSGQGPHEVLARRARHGRRTYEHSSAS